MVEETGTTVIIISAASGVVVVLLILIFICCGKKCACSCRNGYRADAKEEDYAVGDPNFVRSQRSQSRDADNERRSRDSQER